MNQDILRWPIPWIWGALMMLIWLKVDSLSFAIPTTFLITIAASAIHLLHMRAHRQQLGSARIEDDVNERLAQIEKRLTDTQDVMIALSEKMDRWEEDPRIRNDQCPKASQ